MNAAPELKKRNLIFLGAPGAGKGTIAHEMVKKYRIAHISTGDILRGEVAAGTPAGKQAEKLIGNGQLVPDELVAGMVRRRIAEPDCKRGFILDGFPRTIAQAEALKQMLAERGHELGMMIELIVGEDVLMARLLRRATLEGRADDNEETIRKRFEVYHSQTEPLSQWFAQQGIRHTFDWSICKTKEGMLEAIFREIEKENG